MLLYPNPDENDINLFCHPIYGKGPFISDPNTELCLTTS